MKTKDFSIELSYEAEIDFEKSYEYYKNENPKVADNFFQSINISFENIKQNPTAFPLTHKNIRKYIVKKYPFVIYYRIANPVIQVIAIFHASRSPQIWNQRI